MSSKYSHSSSLPYGLYSVLSKGTGVEFIYLIVAEAIQIRLLQFSLRRRDLAKQSRSQGVFFRSLASIPGLVQKAGGWNASSNVVLNKFSPGSGR